MLILSLSLSLSSELPKAEVVLVYLCQLLPVSVTLKGQQRHQIQGKRQKSTMCVRKHYEGIFFLFLHRDGNSESKL